MDPFVLLIAPPVAPSFLIPFLVSLVPSLFLSNFFTILCLLLARPFLCPFSHPFLISFPTPCPFLPCSLCTSLLFLVSSFPIHFFSFFSPTFHPSFPFFLHFPYPSLCLLLPLAVSLGSKLEEHVVIDTLWSS